jgi:hypothetical protein
MDGLIEGRIVHFVMPEGDHRPAVIVKVWEPYAGNPDKGMVNLQVFVDGTNDASKKNIDSMPFTRTDAERGLFWATSRFYSEDKEPGTWHWIEKA